MLSRRTVGEKKRDRQVAYVDSCRGKPVVLVDQWEKCDAQGHTGWSRSDRRHHIPATTVDSVFDNGRNVARRFDLVHSAWRPDTLRSRKNLRTPSDIFM